MVLLMGAAKDSVSLISVLQFGQTIVGSDIRVPLTRKFGLDAIRI